MLSMYPERPLYKGSSRWTEKAGLTNLEAEVRAFRASRSISSNFIKTINFSTDYYIFSIHGFIYRIIETYFM